MINLTELFLTEGKMDKKMNAASADPEFAETLAIEALGFLAADPERLARFLRLTGMEPATIRRSAREPGFLSGVLEYVLGDEALLVAFCTQAGRDPARVEPAHRALSRRA